MKDYHYTGYNNIHREDARSLRKAMTKEEKHLWYDYLKTYPIKIYRQRCIDHYIVDFYCPKARLVIELDGSQHYTDDGLKHDAIRTCILEKYHLQVIRFTNEDIKKQFEAVCSMIDLKIRTLAYPSTSKAGPPPLACPSGYSGEANPANLKD